MKKEITPSIKKCRLQYQWVYHNVGIKGENTVKRSKKDIRKKINIKTQVTYKAKKLASKYHVEDEIKLSNKHNITYAAECLT